MKTPTPYEGNVLEQAPLDRGWQLVPWDDESARARAMEIARAVDHVDSGLELGTLGAPPAQDDLPLWHYRDELLTGGLYRFFHFEHAAGRALGAMRFVGGASTLGAGVLPDDLQQAASDVVDAIGADPSYCSNVSKTGTAVYNAVHSFKTQWNQAGWGVDPVPAGTPPTDPSSTWAQYSPLQHNGLYDSATAAAVDAIYGSAPAACAGGGGGGGGSGQTTNEPVPTNDSSCTWVADASNTQIVSIANTISYSDTPVKWADQGSYDTTSSDGTKWRLVMWWENGKKMVAAFRCQPGGKPAPPTPSQASTGSGGVLLALGAAVLGGAGIWAGVANAKKHAAHPHF